MNVNLGVVDISSDEEEENRWCGQNISWFSDVFDERERLDDVVVVGDYSPAVKDRYSDAIPRPPDAGDISDDDCVVLDGDPDGPICVSGDDKVGVDGSDDVVVVAEKGQSACRDYPHPRHVCANFPFSSTPHEKFCSMCHCYVCDSPAPCYYWGNGNVITDHCHSTDKEARWRIVRESLRQRSMPSSVLQKPTNASQCVAPPLYNPTATRVPITIAIPPCNAQRPQPCARTYVPRPAIISQRRASHSVNSHFVRTQSFPRTHHTQRHRNGGGDLAPQTIHDHPRFKRVGIFRSLSANSHSIDPCDGAANLGQMHEISSAEASQVRSTDDGSDTLNYWRNILAGLAKDLGVEEDTNGGQLGSDFSESSSSRQSHSQVSTTQDEQYVNCSIPLSGYDVNCLNFVTSQNNMSCQQKVGLSNPPASKENIATEDINLKSCLSSLEIKDIPELATDRCLGDLDTASLLCDLDMPWSPL